MTLCEKSLCVCQCCPTSSVPASRRREAGRQAFRAPSRTSRSQHAGCEPCPTLNEGLAAKLALFLAADVGLTSLNDFAFATYQSEMIVAHRLPQPMFHKPCRLVSDLQRAVQMVSTDALLAGCHEVRGLKPDAQLDVAALKNGTDRDREFALAGAAAAQAGPAARYVRNAVKAAAAGAMRSLRPYDLLKSRNGRGLIVEVRRGQDGHGGFSLWLTLP